MRREDITIQQSPLPSGYRQLEYIESTGTQRISIPNYYPSTSSVVSATVMYKNNDTDVIFQTGTGNQRFMLIKTNVSGRYDYVAGNGYKQCPGIAVGDWEKDKWQYINFTFNELVINGNTYTINGQANVIPNVYDFNIFAQNWGGYGYYIFRLKGFNVLSQQEDINLIPALRLADSKPGLYDIVNNVFYTNAGTGEFLYN